jgi:hypothetical protein
MGSFLDGVDCSAFPGNGEDTGHLPLINDMCNLPGMGCSCQTASHEDRKWAIRTTRIIAMAIDPLAEKMRSFAEAAQRLPTLRGGKPVNPSTVWRWTKRGVRARNGVLIRLESIKVGGTCCTSDEAMLRFFRALSADAEEIE